MKVNILFLDNNPEYQAIIADLLSGQGYRIICATTTLEAEQQLNREPIHLILSDLRLVDDDDPLDRSGLLFIQESQWKHIPQVMVTSFPDVDVIREAVPHVKAIAFKDDPRKLLQTVKEIVEQHVLPRSQLQIIVSNNMPVDFRIIADLITHGSEASQELRLDEELAYLFNLMFPRYRQVRIGKVLWHRQGRVALSIFLFGAANKQPRPRLLICGWRDVIDEEGERFFRYRPIRDGTQTLDGGEAHHTSRLAGRTYTLMHGAIEHMVSLDAFVRFAGDDAAKTTIDGVLKALIPWHHSVTEHHQRQSVEAWYSSRLKQISNSPKSVLAKHISFLCHLAPLAGWFIEETNTHICFHHYESQKTVSHPCSVFDLLFNGKTLVPFLTAPGHLNGDNILTDGRGKVYLTDFFSAGPAPWTRNYHSLEALVRFDWLDHSMDWANLEASLTDGEFTAQDELDQNKTLGLIQHIRNKAEPRIENRWTTYHLGMFFHAVRRLIEFEPSHGLINSELNRLLHCLFAAGLLAEKLDPQKSTISTPREHGYQLDEPNRIFISPAGQEIKLTAVELKIMARLLAEPSTDLSRQTLGEAAWPNFISERDHNKLTRNVGRLRIKLEDDEGVEIKTVRNGYCLLLK